MKSKIKGILAIAILSTIMVGTAVANGYSKKINVVMNSINIKVNGKSVEEDNILHKGTTYVSLRVAGEMLGREVGWDEKTKTATIGEMDNPEPHLPPLIGSGTMDELIIKKGGSFENPVGIPSTASLIQAEAKEKWHKYTYRLNLPGGGYIEEIIFSNPDDNPKMIFSGYDNKNEMLYGRYYADGRLSYMWRMPVLTEEDTNILRHEGKRFLSSYGY